MKAITLILAASLAFAPALRAGELGKDAAIKIGAFASARKLGAEATAAVLREAKAAYRAGASEREILATLSGCPEKAQANELLKTLGDFRELLAEGLLDREARKVALKGLELRLKNPGAGFAARPQDAAAALRLKRDESLSEQNRMRREEIREHVGLRGQDGDLAKPTPTQH